MEEFNDACEEDKTYVMNEASLTAYLDDTNTIVKCLDFYDYNDSLYLVLEHMNQGPIS